MNHRIVTVLLVALVATATAPVSAAARCDAPRALVDRKACEAAAQGPQALRRFIARAGAMWNIWYFDYRDNEDR